MKALQNIIMVVFIVTIDIQGQVAAVDFDKVNSTLLATKNLMIETEYKVFLNHTSSKVIESSRGILKQKGGKIYQSISTLQSLVDDKISIHLDTAEKILVISDPISVDEQKKQALQLNLKENLSLCKSIVYKELRKDLGVYYLEYKEGVNSEIDKCEIYIDKKTYFVSKLVFYYNEPLDADDDIPDGNEEAPRLEISFVKIDSNPKFNDKLFNEDQFIVRKSGLIIAASAYKGYRVIDNRKNARSIN